MDGVAFLENTIYIMYWFFFVCVFFGVVVFYSLALQVTNCIFVSSNYTFISLHSHVSTKMQHCYQYSKDTLKILLTTLLQKSKTATH